MAVARETQPTVWTRRGERPAPLACSVQPPDPRQFHQPLQADEPLLENRPTYPSIPQVNEMTGEAGTELHKQAPGPFRLAARVSQQILGDGFADRHPTAQPIGAATGWEAVGQQLASHLERSTQLASRGVFYSAREEANLALLQLARHLDLISNSLFSEPHIHAAQLTLREVADFAQCPRNTEADVLRQIVDSHETPVLKLTNVASVSPLTLAQHYYQYAESRLIEATRQHPWFSEILYVLGRTYQAEADLQQGLETSALRAEALVYYRAALANLPTHALAANQLGYLLLQVDRPVEAQSVLIASVDARLDTPALRNLVEASRRLGDTGMQQWAWHQLAQLSLGCQSEPGLTNIQMVDPPTFIALSPYHSGPKSVVANASTASPPMH